MSDNGRRSDIPWLGRDFFENQAAITPEQLIPYAGLHIAWSWDGSRVLVTAETEEEMEAKLVAAGIDPSRVVGDYIPPLGTSLY